MTSKWDSLIAVPPEIGTIKFSWSRSLWLYSMLGLGLLGLPGITLVGIILTIALGTLTLCVGHSVGLHRGLIHNTYGASPTLKHILAALFVFTGLGGPVSWMLLHRIRDYWQRRENTPDYFAYQHGFIQDFWWNLHFRFEPVDWNRYSISPESIANDGFIVGPWITTLEQWWFPINLVFGSLIFFLGGWSMFSTVFCLRIALSILGHWFVGFMAHKHGEKRFDRKGETEVGRNTKLLGIVSFGEGFHNNHHAFPWSARMGLKWYEFDLGWYVLRLFKQLGIVWDLRSVDLNVMDMLIRRDGAERKKVSHAEVGERLNLGEHEKK